MWPNIEIRYIIEMRMRSSCRNMEEENLLFYMFEENNRICMNPFVVFICLTL